MSSTSFDPVTMDPPAVDLAHPPFDHGAKIVSGGAEMNGVLYVAQGSGTHATVVLLPGYPGGPGIIDLGRVLHRAGYNVLLFNRRGTYGSGGDFSWCNARDDVAAAVSWLRQQEKVDELRIDPECIILIGHSFGGWLALQGAIRDPRIRCVAGISPSNIAINACAARDNRDVWQTAAAMLDEPVSDKSGPVRGASGEALVAEAVKHLADFDLCNHARTLRDRALLIVGAARDQETPMEVHVNPLVAALREAGAERLTTAVLDDDHSFTSSRIALARTVLDWLEEQNCS